MGSNEETSIEGAMRHQAYTKKLRVRCLQRKAQMGIND